jgi:hypothetical protein
VKHDWIVVRERAVGSFGGELPHAEAEAAVVEAFKRTPQAVIDAIEQIAASKRQGMVRSGWAVLRVHVAKMAQTSIASVIVSDADERARRVANAHAWLRNAGIHFDRESEIEDALFGERGALRAWADDRELVASMLALWRELRPEGERLEAEAERQAAGR